MGNEALFGSGSAAMVDIVGSASDKDFMANAFLASRQICLQGGAPRFVQRVCVVEFLEFGFAR